jgi:hypothetical protein
MPNIDLSILNQRQTPAFYASSLATRPSFGFAGRIFIDTDSPSTGLYRDTGSAWVQIADPGAGTTGTLQQVTTNGNTTSQGINITAGGLSSNIVTIAANGLGSTANYIGQTMATNDNWKIYGTGSTIDQGELVFEVGDNGVPIASNGQRFRFSYDGFAGGSSKDVFIVDYNSSNFNTNLIVSSGNNLGVGVSVPSGLIHADGGASAARMIIDADNGVARIFSFRTDNLPRWALRVDGTETGSNVGGDFSIRRYDDTGAFVDAPLSINRSTGQSTFSKKVVIENNAGDQNLQIVSTTAPSIRLDNIQTGATKRAGLGISTATNNFIQGSADSDFCIFNGSTTASPILFGVYDAGAGNVQEAARISPARNFLLGTVTDSGEKLIVNGSGFFNSIVGIGASPNASFRLDIYQPLTNTTAYARIKNNRNRNAGLVFETNLGNFLVGVGIGTDTNQFQIFDSNAGQTRLIIDSGGTTIFNNGVLIGTASAGTDFSRIAFATGSANVLGLVSTDDSSGGTFIAFRNSATTNIGNISRVLATNAVAYNTSSDYRLKEDFKEIKGLEKLSAIKVYDFKWKGFDSRMDGVIAHELAEILPYAVYGEKDGKEMQGVDYSKLVPILVKAIQELNTKIENLKN